MNLIDVFNFKNYFKKSGDGHNAKIGHVNVVIDNVTALETTVNALPTAPTTTVVNISSAQILAMGTTPIELLPALSANQYYDYTVRLRNNFNTVAYTANGGGFRTDHKGHVMTFATTLLESASTTAFTKGVGSSTLSTTNNLTLTMNADPLNGDGTFTVQIVYRIITIED